MNNMLQPECPRTEQLSAMIDDELASPERAEIETHAASCPLCGAMLQELGGLRLSLRTLAEACPGIDLTSAVGQRLRALGTPPRASVRDRSQRHGWRLMPVGLVAAGIFATGLYLGALLVGGAAVTSLQIRGMAMFDPIPPGGLCVGLPSCYALRE